MKKLKESFRLNGLPNTLLNVMMLMHFMASVLNDKILHYEVDIIYIRKDKYGEREHIAKNDDFGRDRSKCYINKDLAYKYFDKFTTELINERNLSQGVSKSIAGVQENVSVIPEVSSA